jgi:hypothetical protein
MVRKISISMDIPIRPSMKGRSTNINSREMRRKRNLPT